MTNIGSSKLEKKKWQKIQFLPLLFLLILTVFNSGCFKDKGGGAANSVLNLTPEQKLHAVKQILNEQKLLTDDKDLKKQINFLEKALVEASGEMKYKMIYYLTFLRVYYASLLAKKASPDRRDALELLRYGQKDVDHFRKGKYLPDEHKFLTALLQTSRLEFETGRKQRHEAYEMARLNLLYLMKNKPNFETIFTVGDLALRREDVILALARLYRIFNDPFRAMELHEKLERRHPLYYMSPIPRIERASLQTQLGDYEGALASLAEFKGKVFSRELFYEEGLWLLEGIYKELAKEDSKYSLDAKTFKAILKDAGTFYAKGAGDPIKYFGVREKPYFGYGKALKLFYASRINEALEILWDILDDPKARKNEWHQLDSSRNTIRLAHYLTGKCLEETGSAEQSEIQMHFDGSDFYYESKEVDLTKILLQTEEIRLDVESLMPSITGENKLKKPPVRPPVNPATQNVN